jgi:hypothetical protein
VMMMMIMIMIVMRKTTMTSTKLQKANKRPQKISPNIAEFQRINKSINISQTI